ncbi:MAG TPA: sensor histidine kinase [Burkholderiaceae bacterium]|nr:sensor histidine kinase [Burkholderiaceae bacterium]
MRIAAAGIPFARITAGPGRFRTRCLRAALVVFALVLGAALPARAEIVLTSGEWASVPIGETQVPTQAAWSRLDLPLRWMLSEGWGLTGVAMRFHFDLKAPPNEAMAALIPVATEGGRVTVNGRFIGAVQAPDDRTHVNWQRPHLLAIDPALLVPGENTLLIQTAYRAGNHVMGRIEIGTLSEMSARFERDYFLTSTLAWIGATLSAVIALIFGVLWLRRPDRMMGLITVAAMLWCARCATFLVEIMPLGLRFWIQLLYYGSIGGFAGVVTLLLLRMSDLRNRREEWMILGYSCLGAVALVVTAQHAAPYLDAVWIPGLIIMPAFAVGVALNNRLRARRSPHWIVLAACALLFVAWAHDYAVGRGWLPPDGALAMHWAGPLLLMALATPLVDRFVDILREAESARAELETRVREREQLLKRNFERLRQSERAQAENQERQRIMQDMHDGLGSQLLTSLMLVERGAVTNEQVAQILRESIDDMRLAIDALAPEQTDLGAALGNLRFRMEPRLKAAEIELVWDARNLPEEVKLDQDAVLPILRIVQEAMTNAIKHSKAKAVRVILGVEKVNDVPWLDIRVADNGSGIVEENSSGRGLLNMRNRAGKIGALLNIETKQGSGTVVQLLYKLDVPGAPGSSSRSEHTQLNTQAVIERARMT